MYACKGQGNGKARWEALHSKAHQRSILGIQQIQLQGHKDKGDTSDVLCNIPSTTLICISPTLKLCCTKHLHWSVVCLGSTVHTCSILNGLREGQPTIMSPHDHGWHCPTSSTPLSLSPSQQQISYDCKLSFGVQTLRECYYLSTYTGYLLVL